LREPLRLWNQLRKPPIVIGCDKRLAVKTRLSRIKIWTCSLVWSGQRFSPVFRSRRGPSKAFGVAANKPITTISFQGGHPGGLCLHDNALRTLILACRVVALWLLALALPTFAVRSSPPAQDFRLAIIEAGLSAAQAGCQPAAQRPNKRVHRLCHRSRSIRVS